MPNNWNVFEYFKIYIFFIDKKIFVENFNGQGIMIFTLVA
jgi:hypothetical protein